MNNIAKLPRDHNDFFGKLVEEMIAHDEAKQLRFLLESNPSSPMVPRARRSHRLPRFVQRLGMNAQPLRPRFYGHEDAPGGCSIGGLESAQNRTREVAQNLCVSPGVA